MADTLQGYELDDAIREYKVIIVEPISKFKEVYDFQPKNDYRTAFKDFSFKKYPYLERDRFFYSQFVYRIVLLYKVYKSVKSAKSFNDMIKKISNLNELCEKKKPFEGSYLFDFSKSFDQQFSQYFEVYIISKWLKFKPNIKFKPIFEKIRKLLNDEKWF